MNPGETHEASVFVSSFGKPLDGVDVIMDVARNSIADTDCGWNICSNANGQPRNAAQFSHTPSKKRPGLYEFKITAFDPDIFLLYHNLYPIMWKNDIIDLSSYADVKKRNRMLKYAMFETDFDDPRYMPISRDLSKGKAKLIKNWMECGMIETDNPVLPTCDYEEIKKRQKQVKQLVQRAITLELTTIPPYYTAWLSLQTEFGRNREAADILKSVFVDEMLHMSLAANI
uniref:uncharacterized protein LOC120334319 isoform X1 n=1 Tax=Styela clava TaxID=7725 RepID=UPI0019398B94|nr:uncharacterized protein LOC120334319 isoform X1 [Styela clava]